MESERVGENKVLKKSLLFICFALLCTHDSSLRLISGPFFGKVLINTLPMVGKGAEGMSAEWREGLALGCKSSKGALLSLNARILARSKREGVGSCLPSADGGRRTRALCVSVPPTFSTLLPEVGRSLLSLLISPPGLGSAGDTSLDST